MGRPQPSHAVGETMPPMLFETVGQLLDRVGSIFATREALVDYPSGRRWSYQALIEDVDAVAGGLLEMGIGRGDRVGIWAPNIPEWIIVQLATARIGAILVNINPAYRVHELTFALNQSGCRLLIAASGFKGSSYVEMIASIRGELPSLEEVIFFGSHDWAALSSGTVNRSALTALESQLCPRDPINIQYTSGTTGFPKGATLSHLNIINNAYFVGQRCCYSEQDRICIPVPFYHCFGMVLGNLAAVSHGACMVIPAPSFEPPTTLAAVQNEKCTSLYGVPTMFIAEFAIPDFDSYDLSSLRTGIMAGSPCPVQVMKRVIAGMGCRQMTICYGMTETSPVSAQTLVDDELDRRVSTVGVVHPHVEVKIVDPESGSTVLRGLPGELCTRGYSVMLGYWQQPEKTAECIDAEGWMHSGDLATMDADGYLAIVGRIKDMIIRGGENISPREIEEFLHGHPDVAEAQVVGIPDVRYGEQVCAWIRLRPGASAAADDIREYCRGRVAHFKVSHHILFVGDFPMTVTGKVRKIEMRELSLELLRLAGDPVA